MCIRDSARADRLLARAEAAEARVAELEAQLDAQGWRPGAEKLKHDWYPVSYTHLTLPTSDLV